MLICDNCGCATNEVFEVTGYSSPPSTFSCCELCFNAEEGTEILDEASDLLHDELREDG